MATSNDLQEHANFTRLSRLLVDKGTEALRTTLDACVHQSFPNITTFLNGNRKSLLRLRYSIIKDLQWDLLFPSSGNPPDSKTFDVTLLTVLLRSICWRSHPPATGWDTMPPDTDRSPQANVVRIKLFRNEVYAHVTSTRIEEATFESLWQKISQALVDLNIPRKEIDDLKISALGPEEESYVRKLKEWYLRDEDIKNMLDDLKTNVDVQLKNTQHLIRIAEENSEVIRQRFECPERGNSEEVMLQKLAKQNFKSKIANKVKSFHPGTRKWLLKDLDEWFTTKDESSLLLLTAGPGFGKSVFAAKVCELYSKNGKLGACHFCDFSNSNLKDPMIMLQSLASQMCENVAGFKELLIDQLRRHHRVHNLNDAFQIYLQNPLDELEVEPFLIVIDGLDESATDEKSDMVTLIDEHFPDLPKCVKVLITSRPELSLRKLDSIKKLEIKANNENNELDLQEYLNDCLRTIPQFSENYFALEEFLWECEGSFLYAFHVQLELRKRKDLENMTFAEIISILPQGLNAVYKKYFQRLENELKAVTKKEIDLIKLLEILAATNGPLPLKFVAQTLGLDLDLLDTKRIIGKVDDAISCLLYVSDDSVTVFHKSVYDWLLARGYEDHEYTVKASDGKKQLWLLCQPIFEEVKENVHSQIDLKPTYEVRYALKNGCEYLVESGLTDSFEWLVDMVIVHVCLTIFDPFETAVKFRQALHEVLRRYEIISLQLRQRISWHLAEMGLIVNFTESEVSSAQIAYLVALIEYSPEGCFTEREIKIAKSLVANASRCVNRASVAGATAMKIRLVKIFHPYITAVGISSNRQLAAVADSRGTIFILSLPELVTIWQYSTGYENICCCIFSPNDSYVLYGKLETVLCMENKKEVTYFRCRKEQFKFCGFSPNSKRLVTSDGSHAIKLWDVTRQSLVSVLYSGRSLNNCSFSNTGFFVIGSMKFADENLIHETENLIDENLIDESLIDENSQSSSSEFLDAKSAYENSYCMWNAITFQRVDVRTLPIKRSIKANKGGKSEICNRCNRPGHAGIKNFNMLKMSGFRERCARKLPFRYPRNISFGVYNNMNCIFILHDHSLWVYECIHFTILAAWEMALPLFSWRDCSDVGRMLAPMVRCGLLNPTIRKPRLVDIGWIASDALLVSTNEHLIIFSPKTLQDYSSVSRPTLVLWCSFSPDSTRLATCTSDGFINLWNVSTCEVYQRIRNNVGTSLAACCWSNGHLFVFLLTEEVPKVTKYLIDENFRIDLTKVESVSLCCVVNAFGEFSRVIDFSQGFLSFKTIESVKVLNIINMIDNPEIAILPGSRSMPDIAFSADVSVAFGAAPAFVDDLRGRPHGHVILWRRTRCHPVEYEEIVDYYVDVPFSDDVLCCVSIDRKFAVAVAVTVSNRYSVVVVDVDACTMVIKSDDWGKNLCLRKIFSANMTLILAGQNYIKIVDMQSLRELEFSLQRSLRIGALVVSKLSPEGKVIAVPNVAGRVEFFRLAIPALSRSS